MTKPSFLYLGRFVCLALASILAGSCGAPKRSRSAPKPAAKSPQKCPQVGADAELENFTEAFGIDTEEAEHLRAALRASSALAQLADRLSARTRGACAAMMTELDAAADPNRSDTLSLCKDAARAIVQTLRMSGGNLQLGVLEARCPVPLSAWGDCLKQCAPEAEATVECVGELAGTCNGSCTGTCVEQTGFKCPGICRGACDRWFWGSCQGLCEGRCDGTETNGPALCAGKCRGSCDAGADGKCGGTCSGGCELKRQAPCSGICRGSCSRVLEDPSCQGIVEVEAAAASCTATCRARTTAEIDCREARVLSRVRGAVYADASRSITGALEAHLPALITLSVLEDNIGLASEETERLIDRARKQFDDRAAASEASAEMLIRCVAPLLETGARAVRTLRADLESAALFDDLVSNQNQ